MKGLWLHLILFGLGSATVHLKVDGKDPKAVYNACMTLEGHTEKQCASGDIFRGGCIELTMKIILNDDILVRLVSDDEKTLFETGTEGVSLLQWYVNEIACNTTNTIPPLVFVKQDYQTGSNVWLQYRSRKLLSHAHRTSQNLINATVQSVEVKCGQIKEVQISIPEGRDLEHIDNRNGTSLSWAVFFGDFELVQKLINKGADVKKCIGRSNSNILHVAVHSCNEDVLRLLIKSGANPEGRTTAGATPLHLAARMGFTNIARRLLELHSDNINATNNSGRSAVHMAAYQEDPSVIDVLKQFGANMSAKDHQQSTALHIAAQYSSPEMIKKLVEYGVPINDKDLGVRTAVVLAARSKKPKNVNTLINLGANVTPSEVEMILQCDGLDEKTAQYLTSINTI